MIGCLSVLALPVCAFAQSTDPAAIENARLQFGPLALQPRFALTNVGVDTNVRNDADAPQRDFTMTFVPALDSWLHYNRALLSSKTSYEFLYFKKTADQRAAGFSQTQRFDVLSDVLQPHVEGGRSSSHQRPNADIDFRVEQVTKTMGGGALWHIGPSTSLDFIVNRTWLNVDNVKFQGVDLAAALSRKTDAAKFVFRWILTPLTTFNLTTVLDRDRFEGSPIRNSDSTSVIPSFELKPSAFISGTVAIGVRNFRPRDARVKGYTGPVSAVAVNYVWREWTKFGVRLDRDVAYAFQDDTPYFLTTNVSVSVSENLRGNIDVMGRFSRGQLSYVAVTVPGSPASDAARSDRTIGYGAGAAYRLGDELRLGFDVDYVRRLSPVHNRQFDGFRFGGGLTYAY